MALLFIAKVLGGDWPKAKVAEIRTSFSCKPRTITLRRGFLRKDRLPVNEIASVEIIGKESETSVAGKIGWGAVGGLALGPVGLLAGAMAGGNHNRDDAASPLQGRAGRFD